MPEHSVSENPVLDDQVSENSVSENQVPENQVPENSTPESPDAAASGHRLTHHAAVAKIGKVGVLMGLLFGLLGFALVVQVRSTDTNSALPTARQEDLVRILDDLNSREDRLRREITELENTSRELTSGTGATEAALNEARRRAQELGILAGTVPATGPGLAITLVGSGARPRAEHLLDAVQELRGAGAEAIEIRGGGGDRVRIGATSYFVDGDGGVVVDRLLLKGPYQLLVVGDPQTMDTALNIPGGVVDVMEQARVSVYVEQRRSVKVTALRRLRVPQYARPAS